MCGRPGNGAPDSVVSGTANAAANETTPRIPAHATMKTCATRRRGLLLPDAWRQHPRQVRERVHPDDPHDDDGRQHRHRRDAIIEDEMPEISSITVGSCRPIIRNANDSSTSWTAFHTAWSCSRVS